MKKATAIACVLIDIGGVLLTDGWDRHARKRAAGTLSLDGSEMEERHHLVFETYEEGRLSLEEYLGRVVFYEKRAFTRAEWRRFMFAQSKPYPEMIDLIVRLEAAHRLKIVVISNEGRELNRYRIRKFKLAKLVDLFVSSCFVHLRKPDEKMLSLALDMAQVQASQAAFIDNTPMFTEVAQGLGIRSVLHTDYQSTLAKLAAVGLSSG
jgi:putative hydrolase of the HAD superfamily